MSAPQVDSRLGRPEVSNRKGMPLAGTGAGSYSTRPGREEKREGRGMRVVVA
jgi:hypothetical protein